MKHGWARKEQLQSTWTVQEVLDANLMLDADADAQRRASQPPPK